VILKDENENEKEKEWVGRERVGDLITWGESNTQKEMILFSWSSLS